MSTLILGQSNEDYHSNTSHLSSSALKLILKDPAEYKRQYIDGERENLQKDSLTEGTLVHSLILEPEKILTEYAVYPGLRRAGNQYEEFVKSEAQGRRVVTAAQMLRCETLAKAHMKHSVASAIINGGLSEHNMVGAIEGVAVKARTDLIKPESKLIVDVKTTSMPSGIDYFKDTVRQWDYDLSAALYCIIAEQTYGGSFDFYWEVLSKDDKQVDVFKMSQETRAKGMAKVLRALRIYKKCLSTGLWEKEVDSSSPLVQTDYEVLEV